MLVDATHPEETRVVVLDGSRLEEFDYEAASKKQLKGNIYLAKVTRVEPSLQAAFVEFGGNRHGFLAFNEIHPDYYQIPVADREALAAEQAALEREAARGEAEEALRDEAEAEGGPTAGDDAGETGDKPGPAGDEPADDAVEAASTDEDSNGGEEPSTGQAADKPEDGARSEAAAPRPRSRQGRRPRRGGRGRAEAEPETPGAAVEQLAGNDDDLSVRRPRQPSRHYKIQEVIKRRQILLVQVLKEERGTKGAALTTFISIPGRYCVLMPNTPRGGGISRKITDARSRKRLRAIATSLEVPQGMGVIIRTAGLERTKADIKRDFDYLLRQWEEIRSLTLQSTAPALVFEEANLIKRALRDLYSNAIEEILVEGDEAYRTAKDFMRMMMPSHAKRVKPYKERVPLFQHYKVEAQLDAMHSPTVPLRSGGYIVINPTEALVSIDVNSGRSTRERNIEDTALKTNVEAAEEVARQVRLRDLAGLLVVDFIDMEDRRNDRQVERRFKEALKHDRARIQLGRISPFGLLEMSRQRMRPSFLETSTVTCPHCGGQGHVRSRESTALHVLRALEEEAQRERSSEIVVHVPVAVALYLLNQKRGAIVSIEERFGVRVRIEQDDSLIPPNMRMERTKARVERVERPAPAAQPEADVEAEAESETEDVEAESEATSAPAGSEEPRRGRRRRRRRGGEGRGGEGRGGEGRVEARAAATDEGEREATDGDGDGEAREDAPRRGAEGEDGTDQDGRRRRRRGRRGGRRRGRREGEAAPSVRPDDEQPPFVEVASEPEVEPEPADVTPAEPEPTFGRGARDEPEPMNGTIDHGRAPEDAPVPVVVQPSPPPVEPEPEPQGEPRRGWWQRLVN
jgi:ribonuclease E